MVPLFRIPTILFVALVAAPFPLGWYLWYRLDDFRREPDKPEPWPGLRPDLYTDEGQGWLRRLWLLYVLLIPWWVLVALLFGRGQ
jgi:hypothetical protein